MNRSSLLVLGGIGGVVVAASLSSSRLAWVGVGLVYVLTAVTVCYLERAGSAVKFQHGVGVGLVAVLLTALLTGIWKAALYSPVSLAFWDVLLSYTLRTVVVAAVIPVSLSTDRRQYVLSLVPIALLIGLDIAETIHSSLPYGGELTLAGHFLGLLQFNVQILVEGLIFGIPLYVVLRGVPPSVGEWLSGDGDN